MDAKIRVDVVPERVPTGEPARIEVYFDDRLIKTIIPKIGWELGADSGLYSCVNEFDIIDT